MRSGAGFAFLLAPGLAVAAVPALVAVELVSLAATLAEIAALILIAKAQVWAVSKLKSWINK